MTDMVGFIPGLPERFQSLPSVQMQPPPAHILGDVTRLVNDAAKELEPGEKGRLVWIATTKGINLALVGKLVEKERVTVTIAGWVASTWGDPIEAGLAGTVSWR